MARLLQFMQDGEKVTELLIDHSVGIGGINRHDDVQLIQFLLNFSNNSPISRFYGVLGANLVVDGVCGNKTRSAILEYQRTMNRRYRFKFMADDGVVYPTRDATFNHGLLFATIWTLNQDFKFGTSYRVGLIGYCMEPLFSSVIKPLRKSGLIG